MTLLHRWLIVLVSVLASPICGLGQTDTSRTECFVVSAGIDRYMVGGHLQGCVNDATNTVTAFRNQQGSIFSKVTAQTYHDGQASRDVLLRQWRDLARQGRNGDVMVLFLSGHGDKNQNRWHFLPFDFQPRAAADTRLGDSDILETADAMARQGKRAVVIVDACFAGQLVASARPVLDRYRDAKGGGLVVMASSGASQMSSCLGEYSAFAKAFADSMAGRADFNRDGVITLNEIRLYARERTQELIRQKGMDDKQDSEIVWSASIPENWPLALVRKPTVWAGTKTFGSDGKFRLEFFNGGHVTMIGSKYTYEGTYFRGDKTITMNFDNGRIVYAGTITGSTMSGTARNEKTSWTWTVTEQTEVRVAAGGAK